MYKDQFGEFECGYWGLKGQATSCGKQPPIQNTKLFLSNLYSLNLS